MKEFATLDELDMTPREAQEAGLRVINRHERRAWAAQQRKAARAKKALVTVVLENPEDACIFPGQKP